MIGFTWFYSFFLKHVPKGGGSNKLNKVLMNDLKKHKGVSNVDVALKLMYFETNGVNVFYGGA
jgi:hypothetical protein